MFKYFRHGYIIIAAYVEENLTSNPSPRSYITFYKGSTYGKQHFKNISERFRFN